MKPSMTNAEIDCLRFAVTGRRSMIEFGCGGSTVFGLECGVSRIRSVESDGSWIEKLKDDPLVREGIEKKIVTFHHVDTGPIGEWGYAKDRSRMEYWPSYWRDIWNSADPEEIDFILIDGRFRVACALYALLKMKDEAAIAIHDFWNRPQYHVILRYFDCVSRADNIGVFVKKAKIDQAMLVSDLVDYSLNQA